MIFGDIRDNVSKLHKQFVEEYSNKYKTHDLFLEYYLYKIYDYICKKDKLIKDESLYQRSKKLHFDLYDRTINAAFEIQGKQHSTLTYKGGFDYTIFLNDRMKRVICKELNITLHYIKNEVDLETWF